MYKLLQQCTRVSPAERFAAIQSAFRGTAANIAAARSSHQRFYTASAASVTLPPSGQLPPPLNFDKYIGGRRDQAARTILVQVNSEKSYPELLRYCSQYGSVRCAHHYAHDDQHYILLEYAAVEEAAAAVQSGTYNEDCSGTVVRSPFLWFRAGPKPALQPTEAATNASCAPLDIVDGSRPVAETALNDALRQAANIDGQMHTLHRLTRLNDIGTRLRFVAARQIEQSLHGMFPHATAYPFGSSVNGFGRLGCDLDLILRLSGDELAPNPSARLVYHTKEQLSSGRSQTQRQMESISDMLQLFLPGVCHVRRILQARVPIIKYRHDHLDLEVDLSMSNLTGVYMSELLYMFGQLDARVMPLMFTVRRWAHAVGLTNASPGRWISNFSLTCLVIFYLQRLPSPILPSINALIKSARRPADVRITEDGINCTFLRDVATVRANQTSASANTDSLAKLLVDFFEFYAQMNFAERGISLNEARTVPKPEHAAVYIVNPLEVQLNVSKNVSAEECERFRIEVRNAAWALDSFADASVATDWGVLSIARSAGSSGAAGGQNIIRPNMFFRPRMVDVSELFGADETDVEKKKQQQQLRFKNDTVRGLVEKIQRKGRADLQQLESQLNVKSGAAAAAGNGNGTTGALPTRARKR